MRSQNQLPGLPLGEPGRYVFLVEMATDEGWETVARVPYIFMSQVDELAVFAPDTGEPNQGRPEKKSKKK